jgi:DNA-binding PadR family transcriptional regulator
MVELAILGLLQDKNMHGYQLKKHLADTLGSFWQVSYGSLYPTLKRLQKEGAVEVIFPKEQIGRRKNVYQITESGKGMFAELLGRAGHDATEDNGFSVRLTFFRYLKPETRIRLLERRRAFLEGRGSSLKEALRTYREKTDSYTLSLMNHELAATDSDIRWLDELIQAERRQVQVPTRQTEEPARRRPRASAAPRPTRAARLAQRERA